MQDPIHPRDFRVWRLRQLEGAAGSLFGWCGKHGNGGSKGAAGKHYGSKARGLTVRMLATARRETNSLNPGSCKGNQDPHWTLGEAGFGDGLILPVRQ